MCLNITTSQQYGGETSSNYNQNYNLSFNCDEISQKSFNTLDNENDHIPPTRGVVTVADHKLFFNIRNIFLNSEAAAAGPVSVLSGQAPVKFVR